MDMTKKLPPEESAARKEARGEVEAFAAILEVHRQGASSVVAREGPTPRRQAIHHALNQEPLAHDVEIFLMAAAGLSKKKGARKHHSTRSLYALLRGFETVRAEIPGGKSMSDRKVIEAWLRNLCRKGGVRESRVMDKDVQARVKTTLNLLSSARKIHKPTVL